MLSNKMKALLNGSSVIRAMFEDGKRMAAEFGSENVYDFSLGNPSVIPPNRLKLAINNLLETKDPKYLHGYMTNSGFPEVREKIADSLNKRFGTKFSCDNIVMTVGAAGGLNVVFKTLLNADDEVLTFSPFFSEYRNYVENFNGKLITIRPNEEECFRPSANDLKNAITFRTKALIVNTPNNPTGIVYSESDIKKIASVLKEKSSEYNHPIFLISDEPYRELVYDNLKIPFLTKYYDNTIVCYSFSKSLSLPGERIGYIVMPDEVDDFHNVAAACGIATRILGFVNAPSLMQLAVAECLDEKIDTESYNNNRIKLTSMLSKLGFSFVQPEGAFYLFMKTPCDDKVFAEEAKKERLLLVPGSAFNCAGYVRIAYCVNSNVIDNSFKSFEILAKKYKLR